MDAANIIVPGVTPGHHNTQGKVENRFKTLWARLELPLALRLGRGRQISESALNEEAKEFIAEQNAKEHPWIVGASRIDVYAASVVKRPAESVADEDVRSYMARPFVCKVDDSLHVWINGIGYEVPNSKLHGKYVRVYQNKLGDCVAFAIDEYHPKVNLITPPEGKRYVARTLGDYHHPGGQNIVERETRKAEARAREERTGNRAKPILRAGNAVAMGPIEVKAEMSGPFANQAEAFESAHEARIWIGMQVMLLTDNQNGYDNYAEYFEPILSESLEKKPVKDRLEVLRKAFLSVSMQVQKGGL